MRLTERLDDHRYGIVNLSSGLKKVGKTRRNTHSILVITQPEGIHRKALRMTSGELCYATIV